MADDNPDQANSQGRPARFAALRLPRWPWELPHCRRERTSEHRGSAGQQPGRGTRRSGKNLEPCHEPQVRTRHRPDPAADNCRAVRRCHRNSAGLARGYGHATRPLHSRGPQVMNPLFVDSFYFFAILNPKDAAHSKAIVAEQMTATEILAGYPELEAEDIPEALLFAAETG